MKNTPILTYLENRILKTSKLRNDASRRTLKTRSRLGRAGAGLTVALRRPARREIERCASLRSGYCTTTVFTVDMFDADRWATRTRILYVPFLAGAFQFSE